MTEVERHEGLGPVLAVLTALVFAIAVYLRTRPIGLEGLWMDEVFSASFANLSLPDMLVAVTRFDVHPPLYYLQLKVWRLISPEDHWLLLNSVLWSAVTPALVFYGVRRYAGGLFALLAMALVAVSGSEILYANELRMYAMITAMVVLAWLLAERWIHDDGARNSTWLLVIIAVLASLHGAAFVPVSAVILYAISQSLLHHKLVRWKPVLTLLLGSLLIFVPFLLNASVRSLSHLTTPGMADVVRTVSGWLLGYGALELSFGVRAFTFGALVAMMLTVMCFGDRRARLLMGCFVVWPLVFVWAVSQWVKPIWIDRALTFAVPFLVMAFAMSLASLRVSWARGIGYLAVAVACISLVSVAWMQTQLPRKMQYKEAAMFVRAHNQDKSAIYVPVNVSFWAIARYFHRADWGSLLAVQDPVKPDQSDAWKRVYEKLGTTWLNRLGLLGQQRVLHTKDGDLWIGLSPLPDTVARPGLWVLGASRQEAEVACGSNLSLFGQRFKGVSVWRCGQPMSQAN